MGVWEGEGNRERNICIAGLGKQPGQLNGPGLTSASVHSIPSVLKTTTSSLLSIVWFPAMEKRVQ